MAENIRTTRQRLSEVYPDRPTHFMDKLLFKIYEHFDEQDLVDTTFKLSNPTALVPAHRLILSAASPYFRELFKSEIGLAPFIEITDIDTDTFERLITFCYTGETLVTLNNVDEMLKAALILQLDDAVADCVKFLIENMRDYTLQRARQLAIEAQCGILSQKILDYEIQNFLSVIKNNEYLDFDPKKMQTLVECDKLQIESEGDVLDVIIKWYKHHASARKQYLPDLVACLRFSQFDTDIIMKNIHALPGCNLIALEALTWRDHPSARSHLTLKYTKNREGQIRKPVESLAAFHLESGTIFKCNKPKDSWQEWADIKLDLKDFRVILMGDKLIFIGGSRMDKITNEVCSWNFKTKTFKQLPAMNQARYRHCVVILNEKIYAIGGLAADGAILELVETYSESDGWKYVKEINTPRYDAAAFAFNNKIYVMGGYSFYGKRIKTVECYDPIKNSWSKCRDLASVHVHPGVTVYKDHIYVVGRDAVTTQMEISRYDPLEEKCQFAELRNSLHGDGIGFASIDNQLWAVGGKNSHCTLVYDEQNEKWIYTGRVPLAGNDVPNSRTGCIELGLLMCNAWLVSHRMKITNEVCSWNFKTKTFKQLPAMNQARYRHCVVILNEKIYAIGGLAADGAILELVETYSESDGWKYVKEINTPRYDAAAFAFNNKIYVMGGYSFYGKRIKTVECYDPIKNSWSKCRDLASVHVHPGVTVYKDHIYVVGRDAVTTQMEISRYDPLEEKCQFAELRNSLHGDGIGFASIDNQLWAVGGKNSHCTLVYDEQNEKWIYTGRVPLAGNDVPNSRTGCIELGLLMCNAWLVSHRMKITNEVCSWNFKTKTFKQLPAMNQARYRHCVVILNEKIYAIGGLAADGAILELVETYSESDGWKYVKEINTPRYDAAAFAFNNKIYVMGGYSFYGKRIKTVECYDPIKNSWSKCRDLASVHVHPGVTVYKDHIYVVGRDAVTTQMEISRYDPLEEKCQFAELRNSLHGDGIGFASIDNQLWAVGGKNSHCTLVYDEQNEKWIYTGRVPLAGKYYCFTAPEDLLT